MSVSRFLRAKAAIIREAGGSSGSAVTDYWIASIAARSVRRLMRTNGQASISIPVTHSRLRLALAAHRELSGGE